MISSVAYETPKSEVIDEYPCLKYYLSKPSKEYLFYVVLFDTPTSGTVVHKEGDSSLHIKVGDYSRGYVPNCFEIYDGTVELKNNKRD